MQQFVPHNGVVHKLYVIGDCHFCGPRNSVRNIGVGDEAITFDSQQAIPEELRDPRAPLETGTQLEEEILGHLVPSLRHTLVGLEKNVCLSGHSWANVGFGGGVQQELDLFGVDVLEAPDGTLFLVDANAFPGTSSASVCPLTPFFCLVGCSLLHVFCCGPRWTGYKTLGDRKFGLIKSLVVQRGRQARI